MPHKFQNPILKLKELVLNEYPTKLWVRSIVLSLAFIILILLSSANRIKIKDEYNPKNLDTANLEVNEQLKTIIEKQFIKANDEIKTGLEQMDTWYHYKFILIGGVIVVFLGHVGIMGKQNSASHTASERILETALMSNRTSAMLTLVCLVALVIDMHIRANVNGIQHLGHWITYYVEPSYLNAAGIKAKEWNQVFRQTGYIPWETFIRLPESTNTLYPISYGIQLHYMTIVSYMFYLIVFQNLSLLGKISKRGNRQQIAFIGFVSVHISLLIFIIAAHTVRDTFTVECFPMIHRSVCSLSGQYGWVYYLLAWLFLIALNLPYLHRLFKPPIGHKHTATDNT
jgi:hypothetical protein